MRLTISLLVLVTSLGVVAQDGDHRYLAPVSVAPPMGHYSQGVETTADSWWVHVAGQVGVRRDGSFPDDFAGQARQAVKNVRDVLQEGGMRWEHVVSYRVYLTDRGDFEQWRELSSELLAGAKPAGTLVFVSGLAHPDWRIEIEATAARAIRRDD